MATAFTGRNVSVPSQKCDRHRGARSSAWARGDAAKASASIAPQGVAHEGRPRAAAAGFDELSQVRDMAGDGQRSTASAALQGLEDLERLRESARHGCHVARRVRTAVQHHDPRPGGPVLTDSDQPSGLDASFTVMARGGRQLSS